MCVRAHTQVTSEATLMYIPITETGMNELDREECVSVDGIGQFDEVDCETFDIDGTCNVNGDVFADHVTVDGTLSVGGGLDAHDLETDGALSVGRDVHVDIVRIDGAVDVGGNLDAHGVTVDGALDVSGSVVAAEMHVDGAVSVAGVTDVTTLDLDGAGVFADVNVETFTGDGALDADDVTASTFSFDVGGRSSADSLTATDIRVSRGEHDPSLVERVVRSAPETFTIGTVEGVTVTLDATTAETVVGEHVTLGPESSVDVVYTDDLTADPEAEVGEVRAYAAY